VYLGITKPPNRVMPQMDGTTNAGSATKSEIGGTVDDSDEVGIALMRAFGGAGGIIAVNV